MELFLDILADAVRDTLVLVPFLFVTYLVLEALEHMASDHIDAAVRKAGPLGPIVGAVLGIVPQCGFSAMGATLYAGRVVTLGTLVAVFLSTSDEMLPLLVAEQVDLGVMARILVSKAIIGMICGLAIDAALRALRANPQAHEVLRRGVMGSKSGHSVVEDLSEAGSGTARIHELCERAHCHCDDGDAGHDGHGDDGDAGHDAHAGHDGHTHSHGDSHGVLRSVLKGAVSHTLQVTVFVFAVTLVLSGVLDTVGEEAFAQVLSSNEVLATFLSALVGLIPNCAASIVITQLYLEGALATGPMMAGSLAAAGAGFLVLFRTNANARENICILAMLYAIGVVVGLAILGLGI